MSTVLNTVSRTFSRRRVLAMGAVLSAFALAAPGAASAADSDGKVYSPGTFDRLEVDGSGQIKLVQGDRDEVYVAGDDDAREGVEIHLHGSRLKLDLPGSWKFWNGNRPQVEVRVRDLSRITISGAADVIAPGTVRSPELGITIAGSGTVHFDDLQAQSLRFEISGAGEGQLAGQVGNLNLNLSGKGKVGADQLRVRVANVGISGVGNAELWVQDALRVDISGAGHVGYWGHPNVQQSISGLGSVDPRGDKR